MRIAIVSDIHGNLAAFEAVLADLRLISPDLIFHGGDLAHAGPSPAEVIDRIRDLGWPGVLGNTDELLFRAESLAEFGLPHPLSGAIGEMAAWTRDAVGEERLSWLRSLPFKQTHAPVALVHASPTDCWRAPMPEASDEELEKVYSVLGQPVVVYAHVHRSYVRTMKNITVANTGSVSLSHDGDPRASYLLLDDGVPAIRRVEYEVDREADVIENCGIPHADWVASMLRNARPQGLP